LSITTAQPKDVVLTITSTALSGLIASGGFTSCSSMCTVPAAQDTRKTDINDKIPAVKYLRTELLPDAILFMRRLLVGNIFIRTVQPAGYGIKHSIKNGFRLEKKRIPAVMNQIIHLSQVIPRWFSAE
jgi:hypothetical protein